MAYNVVVLGAGVSGLTSALQLARTGDYKITIAAKHMPGDYSIEYASPWAGANYLPFSAPSTPARTYERNTWPELARLAREFPEAGIHFQDSVLYRRAKDKHRAGEWTRDDPWFKEFVPNFRLLNSSELPPGIEGGTTFTSVCINTALYLPWLASQCLKAGIVIRRGFVKHIAEAAKLHHTGKRADLIINCTGLSSLQLPGVEDKSLYPIRGQIVVVRNEAGAMYSVTGTDDEPDEAMYIMQRAAGGGTVLGGCMQPNNWESQFDPNLAIRIMKRCVDYCPGLVPEGKGAEALSIVRHGVGLRPARKDGIRLEKEVITGPDEQQVYVIHNYGHGGYGYQTSYGCAEAVRTLAMDVLSPRTKL